MFVFTVIFTEDDVNHLDDATEIFRGTCNVISVVFGVFIAAVFIGLRHRNWLKYPMNMVFIFAVVQATISFNALFCNNVSKYHHAILYWVSWFGRAIRRATEFSLPLSLFIPQYSPSFAYYSFMFLLPILYGTLWTLLGTFVLDVDNDFEMFGLDCWFRHKPQIYPEIALDILMLCWIGFGLYRSMRRERQGFAATLLSSDGYDLNFNFRMQFFTGYIFLGIFIQLFLEISLIFIDEANPTFVQYLLFVILLVDPQNFVLWLAFGHSRPFRSYVKRILHFRIYQRDEQDVITTTPVFNPFIVHEEYVPQMKVSDSDYSSGMVGNLDPLSFVRPATIGDSLMGKKDSTASSSEYYIRSSLTQTATTRASTMTSENSRGHNRTETPKRIETQDLQRGWDSPPKTPNNYNVV